MTDALPEGWSIELDPAVRRTDGGHVLIGGAPLRILRLTESGARWLDRAAGGEPLGASPAPRALARRLVEGGLASPRPPAGTGPEPGEVAVVIPVHDDPTGLARTIATIGPTGEVIVVDDGSRDPSAVRHAAPEATILRNDVAKGPGAAREIGWRASGRPFVAFVDADVEVAPGWLESLLAHLADDTVGAVAPRVVSRDGTAPSWLARYERARSPLDLGPAGGTVGPGRRVPYLPTTALVVRRQALDEVEGFDDRLRFGEDVDLCWRLVERGWRVRYDPAVEVTHPSRSTFRRWIAQRASYGTSAAPLTARHPGAVAPLRVSGWSALAWAAVAAGRPIAGTAVGAGTVAALVPKLQALDHPVREALELAGKGNLWAGRSVADAIRRPWWPLAAALALGSRRARPALAAAALVPPLVEWRERRPDLDPVRYTALRAVDDLAYGTGVWIGCLRARSFAALRPAFSGPIPRVTARAID